MPTDCGTQALQRVVHLVSTTPSMISGWLLSMTLLCSVAGVAGSLKGVVVDDRSQVLFGARVVIIDDVQRTVRETNTNQAGRFTVDGVAAGKYFVRAEKDGYVLRQIVESKVDDGASLEDDKIHLVLVRLTVIAGSVRLADGGPAKFASVSTIASQVEAGDIKWTLVSATVSTDDQGAFRIIDLKPGSYLLLVVPNASSSASPRFIPFYFPRSTSVDRAEPITIRAGEEVANLILTAGDSLFQDINGTIVNAPEGFGPITLALYSRYADVVPVAVVLTDANNRFHFSGIPTDSYEIVGGGPVQVRTRSGWMFSGTPFYIHDVIVDKPGNVLTREIQLREGVSATVKFVPAGDEGISSSCYMQSSVTLEPVLHGTIAPLTAQIAEREGVIRMTNLFPGEYRLSLRGLAPGCLVSSVWLGNSVLSENRITVSEAGAFVTIRLTKIPSAISGTVFDVSTDSTKGVVALLADTCWTEGVGSCTRVAEIHDNGIYEFDGLAPGQYRLQYVPAVEALDQVNALLWRDGAERMRKITLVPAERAQVNVVGR